MVRALLAILKTIQSVWVLELAGAGLGVAAAWGKWGWEAGLAVASLALLLKAFDLSLEGRT